MNSKSWRYELISQKITRRNSIPLDTKIMFDIFNFFIWLTLAPKNVHSFILDTNSVIYSCENSLALREVVIFDCTLHNCNSKQEFTLLLTFLEKKKWKNRKTRAASDRPGCAEIELIASTNLIADLITTSTKSRSFQQRQNYAII